MRINNITTNNITNTNNYSQADFIIPCLNKNFGEIIEYNSLNNDIKLYCNNVNLNYMDIQLLDEESNEYQNNNIDFYFIMEYQ
jgi:hypothetical protein